MAGERSAGPFAFLGRRRFLKLGLGGGGLLLGGFSAAYAWLRGSAPDVADLRVLDAHEYRTLGALAEVFFPADGPLRVDLAAMDLPRAFDDYLADEPPAIIGDLQTALTLLELGPAIYERRATSFSRLPQREREAHFRAWMESDSLLRRQVSVAFRKFLNLVFYDSEPVWAQIHYPGPSLQHLGEG